MFEQTLDYANMRDNRKLEILKKVLENSNLPWIRTYFRKIKSLRSFEAQSLSWTLLATTNKVILKIVKSIKSGKVLYIS